ncbi:MAG: bifunctional phosphoribosylaminoimidazolecarboxamide formyltransferase/IMP cyclohydrolase [Bacteroidales bacterium]|jgi:phosphoribosylaminoimidazolecarboxamide formyltransferase/IMP cyclohydrolase|nr:bifunctional phosphoribosylaminoimidazolecarboxamide formyltransferase/IMP cyclohydrolase [Bacteroidales bacterium]
MNKTKRIKSALISVYHKENLAAIVGKLHQLQVKIYSTGGTATFIEGLGVPVTTVESLTDYPSIFDGRVKTLHPKVFGGILYRRDEAEDQAEAAKLGIPDIDLVIVDLYPFEETVALGAPEAQVIEKIDIGGISLIRAAAKNYKDVVIVPSKREYLPLLDLLEAKNGETGIDDRRKFAAAAFDISSHYDTAIFNYFNREFGEPVFKQSYTDKVTLRYGENPHQKGMFFGNFDEMFEKLHGKEISYNNLLDMDAAVSLIAEFDEPTFAVLKHNNACGLASSPVLLDAWRKALAGDPVSAFGGVLATNRTVDLATAREIDTLFYEVLIAPDFEPAALELLQGKKNRILLRHKPEKTLPQQQFRSLLHGVAVQDRDLSTETVADMKPVTLAQPAAEELTDLVFANKIVKHCKSNAIVLAKGKQMLAGGVGQTSRVDALKHAIEKARTFGFDLKGAVMASDAYFPFSDCVELAGEAGVKAIVQPGGSIRDSESVDCCNKLQIAMVVTGKRHFKH